MQESAAHPPAELPAKPRFGRAESRPACAGPPVKRRRPGGCSNVVLGSFGEDLEAVIAESVEDPPGQQSVLEAPAAQDDLL